MAQFIGVSDFVCSDADELYIQHPTSFIVDETGIPLQISPALQSILDITGYPQVLEACGAATVYVSDVMSQAEQCDDIVITRSFLCYGQISKCLYGCAQSIPVVPNYHDP
ncbi:MAG: hypothetical protein R2795_08855 [Saprospiraceae bacterium]